MPRKGANRIENSEAYQEFNEKDATKNMYKELNELGSIEDTQKVQEKSDAEADADEERKLMRANERDLSLELQEIADALSLIDDIITHQGFDASMSLRMIDDIIEDPEEFIELESRLIQHRSERFKNKDNLLTFQAMINTWLDRDLFKPSISLNDAREALITRGAEDQNLLDRKREFIEGRDKAGSDQ